MLGKVFYWVVSDRTPKPRRVHRIERCATETVCNMPVHSVKHITGTKSRWPDSKKCHICFVPRNRMLSMRGMKKHA